ncbi:MAG: peroxiredoxin [Candidatus Velthaea sp.]|jgi:peroxiredoxin
MKRFWLATLAGIALATGPAWAQLKDGTAAPLFSVPAALGGEVTTFDLKAALAKGPVVLYFYPKSFTTGCTIEAHAFSDHIAAFKKYGATVIGISADDVATQQKFSTQECRSNFRIGSDPALAVAKQYDAVLTSAYASRTSYVIAPDGTIVEAFTDGSPLPHIDNALAALAKLKARS